MNNNQVTLPCGRIETRNSKTKTYTHAVATMKADGVWFVYGWAGRLDLAQKQAQKLDSRPDCFKSVKIIEVAA